MKLFLYAVLSLCLAVPAAAETLEGASVLGGRFFTGAAQKAAPRLERERRFVEIKNSAV
jgi:hypothetical protein